MHVAWSSANSVSVDTVWNSVHSIRVDEHKHIGSKVVADVGRLTSMFRLYAVPLIGNSRFGDDDFSVPTLIHFNLVNKAGELNQQTHFHIDNNIN